MDLPKYADIPAIVDSIAGSTAAQDFPELPGFVGDLLQAQQCRLANLQAGNLERSAEYAQAVAAIQQCADHTLTPRVIANESTAHYAAMVHKVLVRRYAAYDLYAPPSIRMVRSVIKNWEPPNGVAESACYSGVEVSRSTRST